jgi:hypothetical protein
MARDGAGGRYATSFGVAATGVVAGGRTAVRADPFHRVGLCASADRPAGGETGLGFAVSIRAGTV